MSWISVRVRPGASAEKDAVVASLIGAGAQGVQEDGDTLVTFLPATADSAELRSVVARASAAAQVECAPADDASDRAAWLSTVGIHRVGSITVAPPWLADEAGGGCRTIIIDPAMAFGTGEHATTRGVLHLMQQVVRAGDRVADLGAGSAVLSIAAVRLGAFRVAAIEVDPDAIGNAEENVRRNGVDGNVTVLEGDARLLLPLVAPVRVILANILSSVVRELSPVMRAAMADGGQAVVSGILVEERDGLFRAMSRDGWHLEEEQVEGEWLSAILSAS